MVHFSLFNSKNQKRTTTAQQKFQNIPFVYIELCDIFLFCLYHLIYWPSVFSSNWCLCVLNFHRKNERKNQSLSFIKCHNESFTSKNRWIEIDRSQKPIAKISRYVLYLFLFFFALFILYFIICWYQCARLLRYLIERQWS